MAFFYPLYSSCFPCASLSPTHLPLSVHTSNSFHICASIPIPLLWVPLYKSSILPATCPFALPQLFLSSFFVSFTSICRQAHDPPLPTTHSLVCTGHAKHQKSVPRQSPLSPLRPAGKLGLLQGQKCHHVGNCCWCCRGRPSASPHPPAYNYVFHGHGKGRGERGRVVRGLAERGN